MLNRSVGYTASYLSRDRVSLVHVFLSRRAELIMLSIAMGSLRNVVT